MGAQHGASAAELEGIPGRGTGEMMGMNWPAMLLASALAAGAAQAGMGQVPGGRPVFDVTAYGAKRDGSAPATEAFARAIAAAKAAGGGTVYVPAGHYQSGPAAWPETSVGNRSGQRERGQLGEIAAR